MSPVGIGKLGLGAAAAAAVVGLVAGCGSSSSSSQPAAGGASSSTGSSAAAAGGSSSGSVSGLKTMSTSIGTVLVDASGHTVYELVGDTVANQTCTGGCLSVWPAV